MNMDTFCTSMKGSVQQRGSVCCTQSIRYPRLQNHTLHTHHLLSSGWNLVRALKHLQTCPGCSQNPLKIYLLTFCSPSHSCSQMWRHGSWIRPLRSKIRAWFLRRWWWTSRWWAWSPIFTSLTFRSTLQYSRKWFRLADPLGTEQPPRCRWIQSDRHSWSLWKSSPESQWQCQSFPLFD